MHCCNMPVNREEKVKMAKQKQNRSPWPSFKFYLILYSKTFLMCCLKMCIKYVYRNTADVVNEDHFSPVSTGLVCVCVCVHRGLTSKSTL